MFDFWPDGFFTAREGSHIMRDSVTRSRVLISLSVGIAMALAFAPTVHADSASTAQAATTTSSQTEKKVGGDAETEPARATEGTTRDAMEASSGKSPAPRKQLKVYCTIKPDAPHWSKKGKSVIYKTRATCNGDVPAVQLQVTSKLMQAGAPKPTVAATAKETKTIKTNGDMATFYAPIPSGKKVKYPGRYWGHSYAQIVSPVKGTKTEAQSKSEDVKVP